MSGMLGSGGGYRRAVLAVAVTGTVCAGLGLAWYLAVRKHPKAKKSLSDSETEGEKTPPKDEQEPAKSPEKVPQAPAKSEEKEAKPTPGTSVKPTPSFQPKVSEKPPAKPVEPPPVVEEVKKVKEKVEEIKDSKVAETVKTSAEKAKEKAGEIASKVADVASGVKEKAKETISAMPSKEKVVASVENVMETMTEKAKEKLEVVGGKASGDGPSPLSSIESRLDSDIVVIEDTKGPSEPSAKAVGASEGAGDVKVISSNPLASAAEKAAAMVAPVEVPAKEMLPTQDIPSMGTLSSLGDDIEIIHDSPPSTDTNDDTISGDFVKCDKNNDLSQSIEVIKTTAEKQDEKKPEAVKIPETAKAEAPEEKSADKTTTVVETKQDEAAGALGDSNANFEPPSSTVEQKDESVSQLPKEKQESKEKEPEEKK